MAFFDNVHFPFFTLQELNLDWLLKEVKRIAGFMPQNGNVGDILTRKSDGAAWEPPEAVNINIDALPQDTQIMDNDQLIFYDISAQANRKIKPPDLLDSMCSNGTPYMNGTGSAGTSKKPSRYDHVHPTDTSRQAALSGTQMNAVNSGAPAGCFTSNILGVAYGGTGAGNAAAARANLGALASVMSDGIIIDFPSPAGAIFTTVKQSSGTFIIDIPTDLEIPSGKTFSASMTCTWIRGNGTENINPTITVTVERSSAHLLRLVVTPSGVTLTNYQVYSFLLVGSVTMS